MVYTYHNFLIHSSADQPMSFKGQKFDFCWVVKNATDLIVDPVCLRMSWIKKLGEKVTSGFSL